MKNYPYTHELHPEDLDDVQLMVIDLQAIAAVAHADNVRAERQLVMMRMIVNHLERNPALAADTCHACGITEDEWRNLYDTLNVRI